MYRNFSTLFYSITVLCLLFSTSCSKKEEEEVKSAIVVTNFTLASFVSELVDSKDILVFDPLPVWEDPMTWSPSASEIETMNLAKPLVFIAGEAPLWIQQLDQSIKVVDVLADSSDSFRPAMDPEQAQVIFSLLEGEIVETFPEVHIKFSAWDFLDEIESQESKWQKLPKLTDLPKGINDGVMRQSASATFLEVINANYQLYSQAAEKTLRDQKLAEEQEKQKSLTYEGGILPILENSCIDCHNETDQEGDLNFDLYLKESLAAMQPELWEKVAKVISLGQMPPDDYDAKLTENEKAKLYNWSKSLNDKWDSGQMGKDPGKTTVHRLNKNEYNYTIRDLFKIGVNPSKNFPEDGGGEGGFDNNADSLFLPPLLVENYFKSASTIVDAVYADPQSRARYLFEKPVGTSPEKAAQKVLNYWATFIYRKPANEEELARLLGLFKEELAKDKKYDEAMKMPLYAMLMSPNFLYRSSLTEEQEDPYPLNDFELASKLSYFLWSSMPDLELFKLAADGKLSEESILEEQILRMLQDKKSKALGMHFGGQWFGWEKLRSSANPDQEKYPEFNMDLRVAFYHESRMFFNDLVTTNGSIYKFLDSDYTFLNERLAKFYKIPDVKGTELRRVKLKDKNRGGVLGMGSVLTSTSIALRSSPSIRGAYVLRDILGIPLPEPPMNVEQLPEDDREIGAMSFRETLAEHRTNPNCNSCHAEIDPIGFGLEAFDAIGRFRTHQNGVKLDTTGTMPDGTEFTSPADLKKALLKNKEIFARNTVEKMLVYALGRDLTPYDRPVAKDITDKVVQDNGSIQTAFIEVIKSYPFTHRRSDTYQPEPPTLSKK
ncbi:MAG: DUF1592 domain-containing protein [Akkermansiaceae bacterium]